MTTQSNIANVVLGEKDHSYEVGYTSYSGSTSFGGDDGDSITINSIKNSNGVECMKRLETMTDFVNIEGSILEQISDRN